MKKTGAVILAAGKGRRMGAQVPKQYMKIGNKPLFLYSVEKFLPVADSVVLVTDEAGIAYCTRVLAEYGLQDRVMVTAGGENRYDSSLNGIEALRKEGICEQVLVHDGARANVKTDTILRVMEAAEKYGAAIAAIPSKDTVKIADADGFVSSTPDRSTVWNVQTPQGFSLELITEAYRKMKAGGKNMTHITDDAMVVEEFTGHAVKLVMGDETNLKVTVPEDFLRMENYLAES